MIEPLLAQAKSPCYLKPRRWAGLLKKEANRPRMI